MKLFFSQINTTIEDWQEETLISEVPGKEKLWSVSRGQAQCFPEMLLK